MIWKIVGLVGAGSFIINGLSVMTDPNCVTVDFGGQSRVVSLTCYTGLGGALPGTTAGMLSILFGFGILVIIFWQNIKNLLPSSQNTLTHSSFSPASRSALRGKVCNYCKREIPAESQECPNCFPEIIHTTSSESVSTSSSSTRICKYCKKYYSINIKDCPTCFPEVINSKTTEEKVVKDAKKLIVKSQSKNIEKPIVESTPEFKTCPMCAEDIKFAAKKCRYCQHMLDG
jgi:RNA polymerase subunit RPABC4/transcription elongation factor Spt4